MKNQKKCFSTSIIFILFLVLSTTAFCVDRSYEKVKQTYLKLRNTQVEVGNANEWIQAAQALEAYAKKHSKSEHTPEALLNASVLYQELFKASSNKDFLTQAAVDLNKIARDFPGHELVDDALIRRGDILLFEFNNRDDAARSYQEVISEYPNTDMVPIAITRLRSIKSGERIDPNGDIDELTDRWQEDLTQVAKRKTNKFLIVIDPGHGGEDYGGKGVANLLEKDVVLSVAFELEKLLQKDDRFIVRLTRHSDIFVPLAERTNIANDFEADLLLSLHTNASPNGTLAGLETYYLDNSQDQASTKLAERENASVRFEKGEGDLYFMLSDLIQSAKMSDSIQLANSVNTGIVDQLKKHWDEIHDYGVKKAPFYVLVGAHSPCVLVEMFFIDHPVDGMRLADARFRKELAKGIYQGLLRYFAVTG